MLDPVSPALEPVEVLKVWQCIGCGRIDHPQPCVGVCRDQKAELVYASDYRQALERIAALEAVLHRIVRTTPRGDAWEASYRALQEAARRAL
jgi:predicted Fe-S protein YdhL (DUF1289 family)